MRFEKRWIGAPDFPSEWVGTELTSLKRKRMAFENTCISMPFACASGLLQVASDFPGIVCILDSARSGAVEVAGSR